MDNALRVHGLYADRRDGEEENLVLYDSMSH